MEAAKYWYSAKGRDEPAGPVSLEQLRKLAADGDITGTTPVIREGADEWGRYRDFHSGERTREVAEVVMDRAARVAAALQTEESRSFSLGFLIGIVRVLTLPWDIVAQAIRRISDWGAARFISIPADRLTSATVGRVAMPIFVVLWTVWWIGDCICMLILGRPSFSLTLLSLISGFLSMGFPIAPMFGRLAVAQARAAFIEAITVHDFSDRLAWAIKIGLGGYFATVLWAFAGELCAGLAALIGLRNKPDSAPKVI